MSPAEVYAMDDEVYRAFVFYMRDEIKEAFRNADKVLSLSYDKVRQLAMSDIDVEPNLVFNFVNEEMFNKLCAPYRPGLPLKLISIGAASHYKDHRTLLRAMGLLKERGVPFQLTLIGLKAWGGLYGETLEFIRVNGLAAAVNVIDRIARDEVPDYLARSEERRGGKVCTYGWSPVD